MKQAIEPGQQFGHLTALEAQVRGGRNGPKRLCQCVCGKQKLVLEKLLRNGKARSCGCKMRELLAESKTTHGHSIGSKSTLYQTWQNLKARCSNPALPHYKYYGGRGISVCERWKNSFENFLADMGERPGNGYSIDRIDVNGNYEPGNCRWATAVEQARNRRVCLQKP